ncbi:hypothetical protein CCM_03089 [Cordyceps militaris CM01]|uniref:Uncharacterized protein n=1 Tax=Cordyceps militaris (strain CM01) TaxID=983644 RepID=G3J8T5_CORMM|nr:uncharacterized protein CCM_03089 [Cordyceps militaris CM01]EGX94818.1 hypothetical protein CCM_03089 [Cordyceps militaris CM01]
MHLVGRLRLVDQVALRHFVAQIGLHSKAMGLEAALLPISRSLSKKQEAMGVHLHVDCIVYYTELCKSHAQRSRHGPGVRPFLPDDSTIPSSPALSTLLFLLSIFSPGDAGLRVSPPRARDAKVGRGQYRVGNDWAFLGSNYD